tara:strand:+ start:1790 stop:2296 length:507 start_codon:yes stop_codon:yes gene_type:complete
MDYVQLILLISDFLRIIVTIFILYKLPIPIFMKIILIGISDAVDWFPYKWSKKNRSTTCNINCYQKMDKITDLICYFILLFYITKYGGLSPPYNTLLIFLLFYRFIGTTIFLLNQNRRYLVYFPNFFLYVCFTLMLISYFPILTNFTILLLFCACIIKLKQEIDLHYK